MDNVELLKTYFRNEKVSFTGDVSEEIKKMNEQSLAGYLYYVYGQPFYKVYLGLNLIQEKYFHIQKEITNLFNMNNIDHMYIKGSVLANLYPDSALRSRGDIDLIVRKEDFDKANKLLLDNEFNSIDINCYHHNEYIKNDLMIELHRDLLEKNDILHYYFDDIFRYKEIVENNLYKLNNEIHYIYCVYHLNKHLINGEGLRYLLDFYYMHQKWNLDYNFISEELKKIGLYNLFENINQAIFIITNQEMPFMGTKGQLLIDYMNERGIHNQIALGNELSIDDAIYTRYVLSKDSKFKFLLNRLLLRNKKERENLYPRLSKYKLLYPLLLIHRFFSLAKRHFIRSFKLLFSKKDKYNKIINMYSEMGVISTEKK